MTGKDLCLTAGGFVVALCIVVGGVASCVGGMSISMWFNDSPSASLRLPLEIVDQQTRLLPEQQMYLHPVHCHLDALC